MKTNVQLPLNSYTVLDDREYTHYRQNKRIKDKNRIKGRPAYKKFVRTYLRVISEQLLEREGGVCIKNFGYWFNWKPPRKMEHVILKKGGMESNYCFHTDNYHYFPTFWSSNRYLWWSMDKTFNITYKKKLKEQILKGKRYKMYLSSMKQMKYLN